MRSASSAPTCWRCARPSPRPASRAARSIPLASATGKTRSGWFSTPNPAPAVIIGIGDMGDRFRLVLNEIDVVEPDELPKLPVARAVWKPRPDFRVPAESWLTAGGPHHTVLTTAVGTEELVDFATMVRIELLVIDARRNLASSPTRSVGTRPTIDWRRDSDRRPAPPRRGSHPDRARPQTVPSHLGVAATDPAARSASAGSSSRHRHRRRFLAPGDDRRPDEPVELALPMTDPRLSGVSQRHTENANN